MKKNHILFPFSLLLFLVAAILLGTGSDLLGKVLWEKPLIPLGTLVTWLGFVGLSSGIFWGIGFLHSPGTRIDGLFSFSFKVLIMLAILWPILGYILAGNWGMNFSNQTGFRGTYQASRIFWGMSYSLGILPVVLLVSSMIARWIARWKRG